MEDLLLQYYVVYYDGSFEQDFPYMNEFNSISQARNYMDWLENNHYHNIRLEVVEY
jgi:hypothetical protein